MKQENKPTYKNLTFDSVGEMHFYWWCEELQDLGLIHSIELQPQPFLLSDKVISSYMKPMKKDLNHHVDKTILNGHEYTADLFITWDKSVENLLVFKHGDPFPVQNKSTLDLLKCERTLEMYIEVKPAFDQNNMTRLAVLNQKWVMEKFGVFVNIVIPEKLFDKTFTPQRFLTTDKSGRPRTIKYKNIKTVKEFLACKSES